MDTVQPVPLDRVLRKKEGEDVQAAGRTGLTTTSSHPCLVHGPSGKWLVSTSQDSKVGFSVLSNVYNGTTRTGPGSSRPEFKSQFCLMIYTTFNNSSVL